METPLPATPPSVDTQRKFAQSLGRLSRRKLRMHPAKFSKNVRRASGINSCGYPGASPSNCSPDYYSCLYKAAVVPTLSGSPRWECLRVSKR